MNYRKQRISSLVICMVFLFVVCSSLFYIVKETGHHCSGEDCPICANMHQAEQTLKNLGNGATISMSISPMPVIFTLLLTGTFFFIIYTSLVSQKVRLDN